MNDQICGPDTTVQLFTYFGCKKRIVDRVWQAWGDVKTTVEPFGGTAVVSLSQPPDHCVTNMYINDSDCHIVNVLRSVIYDPETVVRYASHPRTELDLHMIHDYLLSTRPSLRDFLGMHIDACDAVLAGWWIWGCNNWLGHGWCSDTILLKTPDKVALDNKDLDDLSLLSERLHCRRNKPTHGNQLTERLAGSWRKKPTNGNKLTESLVNSERMDYIRSLIRRVYSILRGARILYGDFERVLTDTYTEGPATGVILDPPYPETNGGQYLYANEDKTTFGRALKYFLTHNDNEKLRMVFCCQENNLVGVELPVGVTKEAWSRDSGYAKDKEVRKTEVLLFSRGCLCE